MLGRRRHKDDPPGGSRERSTFQIVRELLMAVAVALVLVVAAYDPGVALVLVIAAASLYLLHDLAGWLATMNLLIPVAAVVAAVALGLWLFGPDDFNLAREYDRYAPPAVKRLVSPVAAMFWDAPPGARVLESRGSTPAALDTGRRQAGTSGGSETGPSGEPPRPAVKSAARESEENAVRNPVIVKLTGLPATSGQGEAVRMVVEVRAKKAQDVVPTGRVELCDKGVVVATVNLVDGANQASATVNAIFSRAGTHELTANYLGSEHFAPATSRVVAHRVVARPGGTTRRPHSGRRAPTFLPT